MREPTKREQYMSWARGWTHGAGVRAMAEEFTKHEHWLVRDLYAEAYRAGHDARCREMAAFAERIGYRPSLLRCNEVGTAAGGETISDGGETISDGMHRFTCALCGSPVDSTGRARS